MKINLKKALFMLTGTFLVAFGTYFFWLQITSLLVVQAELP